MERRRADAPGGAAEAAAALALSARLLALSPEVYSAWNARRAALSSTLAAGGAEALAATEGELALTEAALGRNPKSYAAWHHRRWVLAAGCASLERELALTEKLLAADERNFHGWAHRRHVAARMGLPLVRELAYSRMKVEENFSNYSAWHYRSTLLPLLHRGGKGGESGAVPGPDEALGAAFEELDLGATAGEPPAASASAAIPAAILEEEYALVKQALYTEPEDQSGWLYHAWLLGCWAARWAAAERAGNAAEERTALLAALAAQEGDCAELAAAEPRAKWPLLALARLRALRARVSGEGEGGGEDARAAAEAYARLAELDPQRAGYYADAAAGRARVFGGALEGL